MSKLVKNGNRKRDTKEIQRIIRTYVKSLFCTQLKNLKDMEKFPDKYYLPKLN